MRMIDLNYALTTKCNTINSLDENEINKVIDLIFSYYRKIGFPYYSFTYIEKEKKLTQMAEFSSSRLDIGNGRLQQVMHGLGIANSYHPHMWSTQCKKAKTPFDVFSDDKLFKEAIRKRIKYSDSKLAPFNIRKSLKIFSGAQSVSNFRPTIAKYIYDNFCPVGGNVLDPCMGYSGRMIGAWSGTVGLYVGCDPCTKTWEGNIACSKDLERLTKYKCPDISQIKKPFEDFNTDNKFDLVFTSPPYFDLEKYSQEDTQSFKRYITYGEWVEGFLSPLITKSYDFLYNNGFFAINVAGEKIIEDVLRIGNGTFNKKPIILYMRLSKIMGKKTKSGFKEEPIFIWKK